MKHLKNIFKMEEVYVTLKAGDIIDIHTGEVLLLKGEYVFLEKGFSPIIRTKGGYIIELELFSIDL